MTHEETSGLLSAYLDGEMPPHESTALERHVAECEQCASELEALRDTVHALACLGRAKAPDDFVEQVQSTIRHRSAACGASTP